MVNKARDSSSYAWLVKSTEMSQSSPSKGSRESRRFLFRLLDDNEKTRAPILTNSSATVKEASFDDQQLSMA